MAETLELEIVTPERRLVKDTADAVQIPGRSGELGILPGHAPLISELAVGELSYRKGSATHYFSVAWGFAEVLPDKVTILAQTAERPSDIDVARAQSSLQRAEERLKSGGDDVDGKRAAEAKLRAQTRLDVAGKK
jgi:F-type H+-transporting ATPase subunit epsilon